MARRSRGVTMRRDLGGHRHSLDRTPILWAAHPSRRRWRAGNGGDVPAQPRWRRRLGRRPATRPWAVLPRPSGRGPGRACATRP